MDDRPAILGTVLADNPRESNSFYARGNVFDALAFSQLIWPDCFELAGAAFLSIEGVEEKFVTSRVDEHLRRQQSSLTWKEFVDSFNWFEVPHLFAQWSGDSDAADKAHWKLAEVLCDSWAASLSTRFPGRSFNGRIVHPDGTHDLAVAVEQISPPLSPPSDFVEPYRTKQSE